MSLGKITVAVVVLLILTVIILWQRMEIKGLEAEQITLSLSNESLQKARELDADFIHETQSTLQACIDGKTAIANKFNSINRKYKNVTTEQVKGEVLNEKMRKELRHDLSLPLPAADVGL